jgi:DNA-directed RNA polymerase subunit RPC12/RpoP
VAFCRAWPYAASWESRVTSPDRLVELKSYDDALRRTGDVLVGAAARRQRRRRVALGLVGVALIAAAGVLYAFLNQRETGPQPPGVLVRCTLCAQESKLPADPQRVYPTVCPNCGKITARTLWECRRCNFRFVLMDPVTTARCPQCGSDAVGGVYQPPPAAPH